MAPVRWYGGKGHLANWIVSHLPRDGIQVYVEPFCGAASVFWHLREPYPNEVLNDLDGRIVHLFRVLQDREKFEELAHRLIWTPYSLNEFRRALRVLDEWDDHDEITRAHAFYVALNQGISGKPILGPSDWSKTFTSNRGMALNVSNWIARLSCLAHWHERLMRVQLDNRDALEIIRYWDSPKTLFYLDPPYVVGTRKSKDVYSCEQDDDFHVRLVELLLNTTGKVVLSGYKNEIYVRLEGAGWRREDKRTSCHAAGRRRGSGLQGKGAATAKVPRVESLWLSPNIQIDQVSLPFKQTVL